jgi:hypothetical protein
MTPQETILMQQAMGLMSQISGEFGAMVGFACAWWLRGLYEGWMCRGGLPK